MNWLWSEVTHLVLTAPQCTENERLNTLISPSVKYSTALLSPWVARSDVGCNLNSTHFILNKCMGLNQTVQSHTQSYDPINARYLVCHIECNHYVQIHSAEVNANQVHHTVQKQLVCPMQTAWQAYTVVLPFTQVCSTSLNPQLRSFNGSWGDFYIGLHERRVTNSNTFSPLAEYFLKVLVFPCIQSLCRNQAPTQQ